MNSVPTILLVDDEEQLRQSIRLLMELEGMSVLEAPSGDAALEILKSRQVDLILSDIKMPNGDGLQLLDRVRHELHSQTPLILMTGFADVDRETALRQGASDFITKPFGLELLMSSVSRLLAK